jgi:hypothetical protein
VVLIEWRRDLLIVYVLIFVIFCDFCDFPGSGFVRERAETAGWRPGVCFPGSGLFEREQRQQDGVAGGRRRRDGRGERRESPIVYYLIIKGFQQCFPMHWETLLKPNGEG